jgi:hypothetical protein
MSQELPPLDAEVRALLDAERLRPDPPRAVADDVRAKLLAAAVGLGLSASGVAHAAAAGAASGAGGAAGKLGTLAGLAKPAGLLWTTAALGAAVAVAVVVGRPEPQRAARPSPPAAARRDEVPRRAPEVAAHSAPAAPTPPALEARVRTPVRPRPAPAPPAPAVVPEEVAGPQPSAGDTGLAVERTLLERARQALARGQAREALDIAARHERRFPDGRLAEQRERLAIQALRDTGDLDAARRRLAAFEAAFPKSLFLPDLRAVVRTAP